MHPFNDLSSGEGEQAPLRAIIENIAARLCHDFSGPLITLTGAMECAGDVDAEAISLASEAAGSLVSRLRLMRTAWSGVDEDLTPAQLTALLDGLPGRERLRFDLSGLGEAAVPANPARLLLNILILAAEALPAGGTIGAFRSGGDSGILTTIEGPRAEWPTDFSDYLSDPICIVAGLAGERRPQAALCAMLASSLDCELSLLSGPIGQPPAIRLHHRT